MRVAVTGATGFVGAWSAKALAGRGHEVRLVVRDPGRLGGAESIGVDTSEVAVADVVDAPAVRAALEGCDAVLHCAAVVATDPRRADELHATNLRGAEAVLGAAVELGLDPIVHTSSITALFDPGIEVLHTDLPTATTGDAYGTSKSAVETYARSLQAAGAPVTITYPGMVVGPGAGDRFGEVAGGFATLLRGRLVPGDDRAGWLVIDVRDLAEIHAAAMTPGAGPRRYMAGGTYLTSSQIVEHLSTVTGRRMLRLPVPGGVLRAMGSLIDTVTRPTPIETVLTRAAMDYFTFMPHSDDAAVHDELGVAYRPTLDTFRDCIASLAERGRISRAQAGDAARSARSADEEHR